MPLLDHLRVLDLTEGGAQLAGRILADLQADVLLVEPPGGAATRAAAPFAGGREGDPDASLLFWAWNRGKRSLALDLASEGAREHLRTLVADADVLLESFPPGHLERLALGWPQLHALNPRLVLVSITPFGQTGPKAGWAASDITVWSASGSHYVTGDEDRPPCQVTVPQAYLHAAAEAVIGALVAHAATVRDGLGQHVDVSAQQAAMAATQSCALCPGWHFPPGFARYGGGLKNPLGFVSRYVYPCKDGFCSVTIGFGSVLGEFSKRLFALVWEEGYVDEPTRDKDWINFGALMQSGEETVEELLRAQEGVERFTLAHTKQELLALSMSRRVLVVPVTDAGDLVHSRQLAARDYWTPVAHPELDRSILYPGPFARFSATPIAYRLPPPSLDAAATAGGAAPDQLTVTARERVAMAETAATPGDYPPPSPIAMGEGLGVRARGDSWQERAAPALATSAPPPDPYLPPLHGLRVLDFTWVIAGPAATRYLADLGATVVKVESGSRIDGGRTLPPMLATIPGLERSAAYSNYNANKLGLTLNLAVPEGREVAASLVRWADVVVENFSPGAMARWGLGFDDLRAINPSIVLVSSCLNGQTGPEASLAGFGTSGSYLAGFGDLTGWPDRWPAGPFGAYTDYVAPRYTAIALLAALEHRRRTGEGQHVDLSQAEAAMHNLSPALLECAVNGRVPHRDGNASRDWGLHGAFPCRGDDRWVAIAAETEDQWRAFVHAIGEPAWAQDPRFTAERARLANRQQLEQHVSAWTAEREAEEIEAVLQAAGVPCHRVATLDEVWNDPQLRHRGHYITVPLADLGDVAVESNAMRFSRTPAVETVPAPTFGRDTHRVLREILALDDDAIANLAAAGALA